MSTGTILFTIAHLVLFVYTRRKYVGKYKKARADQANLEVDVINLKSKLATLENILDGYDENE